MPVATMQAGTDYQAFGYDALNRLTWAGSTGTPSCGGTLTAGTLTSAQYTQTFSYDTLTRLTSITSSGATGSSPGSYTYGDSAHLHAATATAGGYSATYDAAGDLVCRAPTSATTCTGGSPTGAQLAYDAERRLTHYQNIPGASPDVEAWYLYDGAGNRVEQAAKQSGVTTSTYYLAGGAEEVRSDGSLIKYYRAGGLALGLNTGATASTISYTAADGLGSLQVSLNASGSATALQLNAPYGAVRYSSGVFPTTKGFTGQRSDAAVSGLDYYGARYYDPWLGQFTSADDQQGSNRYGYVKGNPETLNDPTGHRYDCAGGCGASTGDTSGGSSCHSDASCDPSYGKGQPDTLNWRITRYNRTYARCANPSCTVRYGNNRGTSYWGLFGGIADDPSIDALQATGLQGQAALLDLLQQAGRQLLTALDQRIADLQELIDHEYDKAAQTISTGVGSVPGVGLVVKTVGLGFLSLALISWKQQLTSLQAERPKVAAQINQVIQQVRDATILDTGVVTVYETPAPPANGMPAPGLLPSTFMVVWQYSTTS